MKSVDTKDQKVEVEHSDIPGFMAAMTMTYSAGKKEDLKKVSSGDQIQADVVVGDGAHASGKHQGHWATQRTSHRRSNSAVGAPRSSRDDLESSRLLPVGFEHRRIGKAKHPLRGKEALRPLLRAVPRRHGSPSHQGPSQAGRPFRKADAAQRSAGNRRGSPRNDPAWTGIMPPFEQIR